MKYSTILLAVVFTTASSQLHGMTQSGAKRMGDNSNLGGMDQLGGWSHIGGHRRIAHSFVIPTGYMGVRQISAGYIKSGQMRSEQTEGHHRMGRSLVIPAGQTSSGFTGDAHMTGINMGAFGSVRYAERTGHRTLRRSVLTTTGGAKISVSNTKMSVSGPGITTVPMNIRGLMARMMND